MHRPHLLTWGLLGPGKGIEWALRALARLQDLEPTPTYTVAGRTHPKVIEQHGEAYRARAAPARRAARASPTPWTTTTSTATRPRWPG